MRSLAHRIVGTALVVGGLVQTIVTSAVDVVAHRHDENRKYQA
jgi:hypothetical protein